MSHPEEVEQMLGKMAFAIWWRRNHPTGISGWLRLNEAEWQSAIRRIEWREAQR